MRPKRNDSVKWLFLKDHDGRIHLSSDKGLKYVCQDKKEAKAAFGKFLRNTLDVVENLLDCETTTIKFFIEY